ncbi:MAG: benzoate-CoA ligase family protein [Alphaproteobacteria bacterium]|nr:benzoate-CoA ligase family protein [Alphaproteobacteria bacterium]
MRKLSPSAHVDTFARDQLPPQDTWPRLTLASVPELVAYPARMNAASELLDSWIATGHANRPCYYFGSEVWSYAKLQHAANQIANVLTGEVGVQPGERVLIRGFNNPMFVACWFAIMKAGAIAVPTMPLLRARELEYVTDKARVKYALCDERLTEEMKKTLLGSRHLKKLLYFDNEGKAGLNAMMAKAATQFANVDTAADDVALIAFTSGTTGSPKGCMHFHRDILAICDTFSRYVLKPTADDIFAGTPPIAFTFGLGALVTFPMHAGAATVLVEKVTPEILLETIQKFRVSILFTAPTMFRTLADMVPKYDIRSLTKSVSAGETLPLATYQAWEKATGNKTIDGLGSTEMLHIFCTTAGDDIRPGATGKACPGFELRVVDNRGNDVPPGTVGRLAVRGPTGCRYLDDPANQAKYVQDGWNFPGDAYVMDADGYCWYQARTDDMIISAGYNISGPEIEGVLLEHEAVKECAVVASPDPERTFIAKAFVVMREGAAKGDALVKELQDHVKNTIAPYKYPRAIEFVDSLPRTETGKLQRFKLRQQELERGKKPSP